jgi:hypothetical protein
MTLPTPEFFGFVFTKAVVIEELVAIQKQIDARAYVVGNSAIADAKGESDALGPNSHSETLALTSAFTAQGVGSSSSSIAESVAAATPWAWHM